MAREHSKIFKEEGMKDNGLRTNNMDMERRHGIKEQQPTKEILLTVRKTGKESLHGKMDHTTKVTL